MHVDQSSRVRPILAALMLLATTASVGCSGRSSPQMVLLFDETGGPLPEEVDSRTGVFAQVESGLDDSSYSIRLRRVNGNALETLTDAVPRLPTDEANMAAGVRWFDDGAWLGLYNEWEGIVFRWSDGAWQRFEAADCDGTTTHGEIRMVDAHSVNDAWALLRGAVDAPTLCHYQDGVWSSEALPAGLDIRLATSTQLLAVDDAGQLFVRPGGGGEWAHVPLDGDVVELHDTGSMVVVSIAQGAVVRSHRWNGSGLDGPELPAIGSDEETWEVELTTETGRDCEFLFFYGWSCSDELEEATYVIWRIDPDGARTEVAHVVLDAERYGGDSIYLDPIPLGSGRLALSGNPGLWVTPL